MKEKYKYLDRTQPVRSDACILYTRTLIEEFNYQLEKGWVVEAEIKTDGGFIYLMRKINETK